MSKQNRPVIGYSKCGNCRTGRASVHQQAGGSPFLYTRFCENNDCSKKTCQIKQDEVQQFVWDNLEPLQGVEIKEPPVVYKAKSQLEQKPQEPSNNQGPEWLPPEETTVVEGVVETTSGKVDKPSGGKGLALGLLVLAGGLFALAKGVAQ